MLCFLVLPSLLLPSLSPFSGWQCARFQMHTVQGVRREKGETSGWRRREERRRRMSEFLRFPVLLDLGCVLWLFTWLQDVFIRTAPWVYFATFCPHMFVLVSWESASCLHWVCEKKNGMVRGDSVVIKLAWCSTSCYWLVFDPLLWNCWNWRWSKVFFYYYYYLSLLSLIILFFSYRSLVSPIHLHVFGKWEWTGESGGARRKHKRKRHVKRHRSSEPNYQPCS